MERNLVTVSKDDVINLIRGRMSMGTVASILYPNVKVRNDALRCLRYWLNRGEMPAKMYQLMLKSVENLPSELPMAYKRPATSEKETERNEVIYRRWVNGENLAEVGKGYGITRERVRQICIGLAHKKNTECWEWYRQFEARIIAMFIKNNIRNEKDLHEWWGDGKELKGTGVTLESINEKLENKLIPLKREKKKRGAKCVDLTGQRFGRLTVLRKAETRTNGAYWECACDCGNTTIVRGYYLRHGNTKSCGCYLDEYKRSLHGIGVKGNSLKCSCCIHHNPNTGVCDVWNTVTELAGFCYKGEKNEVSA